MRTRPKDRADRIVDAATALFVERGYQAVSLAEIGGVVGISGPAIYHHFPSKEALLTAVVNRWLEQYEAGFREATIHAAEPAERLRRLVDGIVEPHVEHHRFFARLISEARGVAEDIVKGVTEGRGEASNPWTDALLALHPALSEAEAAFMGTAVLSMCHAAAYSDAALSQRRLVSLLATMGRAAVLAPPAAPEPPCPSPLSAPGPGYRPRRAPRERVLAAAAALFRDRGFAGVGVGEIAAAAGITTTGMYRHFENKEDVFVSVVARARERMAAASAAALDGAESPRQALERLVAGYVDLVVGQPDLLWVYWLEHHPRSGEHAVTHQRAQRAYVDDWAEVLRDVRPELSPPEARLAVYAALWLTNAHLRRPPFLSAHRAPPLLREMATSALLAVRTNLQIDVDGRRDQA